MNDPLYQFLLSRLEQRNDEVLDAFLHHLQLRFSNSITSVLFYGSCMRTHQYDDAMLDFYVVVDGYQHAYRRWWVSTANKLLPPNVYYLQIEHERCIYRAKYAVVSKSDLLKKVSEKAFHPYFWARFTQPISYIFIRDQEEKQWITTVQYHSANTFIKKVTPMMQDNDNSENLWVRGLQLTYSAELRTETSQRAVSIYQANQQYFDRVSECLFATQSKLNGASVNKVTSRIFWTARKLVGKILSVLRLMKASMTFANGVDYLAWKIERHTGEKIEISPNLRKYPWIFSWPMLIRLYLSGKIR